MIKNFNDKLYFFCYPRSPEHAAFQHHLICLAEGFRDLGINSYSNLNSWRFAFDKDDYLFRHDPNITPDNCSIVILDSNWFGYSGSFPEFLFHPQRTYKTVFIDLEDGLNTALFKPEFRKFDLIFRTHFNKFFWFPPNVYPWAFGLSDRILKAVEPAINFKYRKKQMLINFRNFNNNPHSVRKFVYKVLPSKSQNIFSIDSSIDSIEDQTMSEYDNFLWAETGGRHFSGYYKRLSESVACACFGGYFVSPYPPDPSTLVSRLLKRALDKLELKSNRVAQWDSWRFWEALAAGCVAFHIDLEKYGAVLPVMPEKWKHYIGVDLDDIDSVFEKIIDNPTLLEEISLDGRQWAIENYSPVPTAIRFLETIQAKSVDSARI
jgi:hypothetical protein